MTLIIAFILITGFELSPVWYAISTVVWFAKKMSKYL